jgi:hypothetical protein
MPRPPSLNPSDRLTIAINHDLKVRLELMLYSEIEKRVPQGAWQQFIEARIREWFDWKRESLEAYGFPEGYFITGPDEMVKAVLKNVL